ncbi:biotin-independent malonate decarboxylase subunit beta [Salinisphaera sp. T31B1]|uniref:biotin-independent malonate decarboxylase subunit beta n=1 Tax=Salinisphaera sp. T31B1 TaxID=727963 RepID=UPI00334027E6
MNSAGLLERQSFVEMSARARVTRVLDSGTMRELLDPFERLRSPWLAMQDIVTQADDGVVIARGTIAGVDVVCAAIEPAFQGGSMGEVGGAKIAGALEAALADARDGQPVVPVLLLETGGVRLQEANCGLAAIAEIHAAIVALREFVPVVGVITGPVGCFGGMSIAAGLCSELIVTREARLGLNGPQVIEQEAGIDEFDSRDRPLIWGLTGGDQRHATGLVERLCDDDCENLAAAIAEAVTAPPATPARMRAVDTQLARLSAIDPSRALSPAEVRSVYDQPPATRATRPQNADNAASSRGARWLAALTDGADRRAGYPSSVQVVDHDHARYIAVVPDADNRFVRARAGEVGLVEGWTLARALDDVIEADAKQPDKRPIIAVIDVPSQAYGRIEEAFGIHQALAAAAQSYARARQAGHPVIGLIVGKAMSGAFLAHGYQANRLIALDDEGVQVHAMGKQAAARITQRTVEGVDKLAETITPMAYDIASFDTLGLLFERLAVDSADTPGTADVARVMSALDRARADIGDDRSLKSRLDSPGRTASVEVRRRLAEQWRTAP